MKKLSGYDYDEVYSDETDLAGQAAGAFTVENLGHDPKKQKIQDLHEGDAEDIIHEEYVGWRRVTGAAVKELVRRGLPLTIRNLDGVSQEERFRRLY
jgi:hypothetical protein